MSALGIFAVGVALCACLVVAITGASMWFDARRCAEANRSANIGLLAFALVCFALAIGLAAVLVEKV